jgi:2-phospho-L-lactate/phosphoenolpyruvate guanylyltransferase
VTGVWAVVPVKELAGAKQRLSSCLSPEERRALATIMLEDVLDALSAVRQLAGVLIFRLGHGHHDRSGALAYSLRN